MRLVIGWDLDGPSFTSRDVMRGAAIGEPTWGPASLLRDLELRLGLPSVEAPASLRVPRWARRVEATIATKPFYAASFRIDRVGTASALLQWRDTLVDAGWNGQPIPSGGDRIDALTAIEAALPDEPLPLGRTDRLKRVAAELAVSSKHAIYEALTLVDERQIWPARWRTIFSLLEERGVKIQPFTFALSSANEETDLGLLQRLLRGENRLGRSPRGDGTLLIVRGDTSIELAELTATFLARTTDSPLVVRLKDIEPLEAALGRRSLPLQGHSRPSEWRPAMQLLPLAVELAFAPRNPYRLLELLTLPLGPFRGALGRLLARAVSRQPGIGGQEWLRQRARAAEHIEEAHARFQRETVGKSDTEAAALAKIYAAERLARVAEWLEGPGADPHGAPREDILRVADRVEAWLQKRMGLPEAELYRAAYAQARAFSEALVHDTRAQLTQEDARQLLDGLARGADHYELSSEGAGRIAHVARPSAILAPTGTVVVWGSVAGTERRPPACPWNAGERMALEGAGVVLQDPSQLLRAEAAAWRHLVLSARERLVFIVPSTIHGEATSPHPLLDEISARLALDPTNDAVITRHSVDLLADPKQAFVDVSVLPALALPEARPFWQVSPSVLETSDPTRSSAATSLEKLASCPLAWVLENRARLRAGAISKVASGPLLNGNLSHRLVEVLHGEGAFALSLDAFSAKAHDAIDRLFATEGATLFLPGAANERDQLRSQILGGVRALYRYLTSAGFRIAGVEEQVRVTSMGGSLDGRLDLRLEDKDGSPAVLDLKWGASTYRTLLKEGRAVQLAAYARALAGETKGALPPAGYFALSAGKPLSADPRMVTNPIEGPSLDRTWQHVEATVRRVTDRHAAGKVHVLGTKRSPPLLEALDVPEAARDGHFAPAADHTCKYCPFDAICGKAWEDIA